MAELKTKPGKESVEAFLASVADEEKRKDCNSMLQVMKKITREKPLLWSGGMVGFGKYNYKGKSGKGGEWFITGFSPRKQNIVIYVMPGFAKYDELMKQLGKHKTGVSCLYVNTLKDIDMKVLEELITLSFTYMKQKFST